MEKNELNALKLFFIFFMRTKILTKLSKFQFFELFKILKELGWVVIFYPGNFPEFLLSKTHLFHFMQHLVRQNFKVYE